MKWVVTDTKYLTKPSKDWQPHIPTANTDTAYIEVLLKTSSASFSPPNLVIRHILIDFTAHETIIEGCGSHLYYMSIYKSNEILM